MKLIQRIAYYSGGFLIGIILLFFFLGGKKASCDYGPNARTLKNIGSKERVISNDVLVLLNKMQLDTSDISKILNNGDVRFSESNTKPDSCKTYVVQGNGDLKHLKVHVENCNKTATIFDLKSSE